MGMDFVSNQLETFNINDQNWLLTYGLALKFGWEPLGTEPPLFWPENEPWYRGNYFSNAGQLVSYEDALELSKAIERAIPYSSKVPFVCDANWTPPVFLEWGYEAYHHRELSKKNKKIVEENNSLSNTEIILLDFVWFCKQGEFWVW